MPARDRLSWFRWNPHDHHADPAVRAMSRDERAGYRDALDALYMANTGTATEDEVRVWAGYSNAEWEEHREAFKRAFRVRKGKWIQKRVVAEIGAAKRRVASAHAAAGKRWGTKPPISLSK